MINTKIQRILQTIGAMSGVAGFAFWVYTFYFISKLPQGDGTGFQWIAEGPLTGVFVFASLPAVVLARNSRFSVISAMLGLVGLLTYAYLWPQFLAEF